MPYHFVGEEELLPGRHWLVYQDDEGRTVKMPKELMTSQQGRQEIGQVLGTSSTPPVYNPPGREPQLPSSASQQAEAYPQFQGRPLRIDRRMLEMGKVVSRPGSMARFGYPGENSVGVPEHALTTPEGLAFVRDVLRLAKVHHDNPPPADYSESPIVHYTAKAQRMASHTEPEDMPSLLKYLQEAAKK